MLKNLTPTEVRTYGMYALMGIGLLLIPLSAVLYVLAVIFTWTFVIPALVCTTGGVLAIGVSYDQLQKSAAPDSVSIIPAAERELLTKEQQRQLRSARGGVLFEKALLDVDDERSKLSLRQIEGPTAEKVHDPEPIPDQRRTPHPYESDPYRKTRSDY